MAGTPSSGRRVALWCTLGLAVVAIGLSYCVHLGAVGASGDDEQHAVAKYRVVGPNGATQLTEPASPDAATGSHMTNSAVPSKVLLGTVSDIDAETLTLNVAGGAQPRVIKLDSGTRYESLKNTGTGAVDIRVGDMVVVHARGTVNSLIADMVIDSRINASAPAN